jgi:TonB family protein
MMIDRFLEIALANAGSALLLAAAVGIASRFIRRPAVTHVLWALVLLRLLIPPVLELPMLPAPAAPIAVASAVAPVALPALPEEAARPIEASGFDITPGGVALSLWLLGASLVAGLAILRVIRFGRLLATTQAACPLVERRVAELARCFRLGRPPRVRVIGLPVSPMLWAPFGVPTLILPAALLDRLNSNENDTLIAHELAHVCRHDYLVRYLELAAVTIFWWHPVVWWATRQLRNAEEQCCDALVARLLPDHARAYAECLVKTMKYIAGARLTPLPAACGVGDLKQMKGRVTMIMKRHIPRSLSRSARVLLCLAALGVLALSPTLAARAAISSVPPVTIDSSFSGEPVSLTIKEADLKDVLRTFSKLTGLKFVIDPRSEEAGLLSAPVTLDVDDTPWDQILESILRSNGLGYTQEGSFVWLHPLGSSMAGDRSFTGDPISMKLDGADINDVLANFEKMTGYRFEPSSIITGKVTFSFDEVPWDQALDMILRVNGLSYEVEGDVIRLFQVTDTRGEMLASPDKLPMLTMAGETRDGEPVYRYVNSGPITEPIKNHAPAPEYPKDLKQAGVEGIVLLQAVITANGIVDRIHVINPDASPKAMVDAARAAVEEWTFTPATIDGEPIAVEYVLATRFKLDDKER